MFIADREAWGSRVSIKVVDSMFLIMGWKKKLN